MIIHSLKETEMRFGQLKRVLSSVSQKVLTQQLRELEEDRLVIRTVHEDNVITVTYSLSDQGKSLLSIIDALYLWGEENLIEQSGGNH